MIETKHHWVPCDPETTQTINDMRNTLAETASALDVAPRTDWQETILGRTVTSVLVPIADYIVERNGGVEWGAGNPGMTTGGRG